MTMDQGIKGPIETYIDVFEYLRSGSIEKYGYERWKKLLANIHSIPSPMAYLPVYLELTYNSPYIEKNGEYNGESTKNLRTSESPEKFIELMISRGYTIKNLEFSYQRKHISDPVQFVTSIIGFQALNPSFISREFVRDLTKEVGENLKKLTEIADYLGCEKNYVRTTFVQEDRSL